MLECSARIMEAVSSPSSKSLILTLTPLYVWRWNIRIKTPMIVCSAISSATGPNISTSVNSVSHVHVCMWSVINCYSSSHHWGKYFWDCICPCNVLKQPQHRTRCQWRRDILSLYTLILQTCRLRIKYCGCLDLKSFSLLKSLNYKNFTFGVKGP